MLGEPPLSSVAGLDLEAVDEVDHVVEAPTGAGSDAASGDCDGQMGLAGAGAADQHEMSNGFRIVEPFEETEIRTRQTVRPEPIMDSPVYFLKPINAAFLASHFVDRHQTHVAR
jgi:hypothetical protein